MSIFPDPDKEATHQALLDPQPGDRFTEMFAYWVYVVRRDGNIVTIMEGNPPCELPRDGKVSVMTTQELRDRLAYRSGVPGYYVRLVDRGNNVKGWV